MRKVSKSLASLLALLALASCTSKEKAPETKVNPDGSTSVVYNNSASGGDGFKLRDYEEKTLPNGLRILFIPDQSLPYVSLQMLVRGGASQDPEAQSGLASFVAELLDKGTAKRSAPQIANDLGQLGAAFDASASEDFTMITASALSMQAEPLLQNFVEIITQPAFSNAEIERMRKQIQAQIARRVDSPGAFAAVAFADFLYGSHPYARPNSGTPKTVSGIKKKHLIQTYIRYFRPNNSILAVVGKYTPEYAKKIEESFGAWQKRDVPAPTYPQIPPIEGVQIRLVDKAGLVQSQIRMGHLGIKRQNEDFIALRMANTILGGAFASRLNSRIRKDLGLTYGVSSQFDARMDSGPFEISTFTKNESTGQLISETLKLLKEYKENGATSKEVETVRGYLKGIFPTAIETPEKLAMNLLLLRLHGIPDTYLTQYLREVDRLSTSDVNRVVKKYIDDKNLKIVVFSSAPAVQKQLEAIGKVEVKKASDYQ